MKKIIHKLRRQPEDVRRNILHILTAAAAIIVILLWTYSLGKTFTSPETSVKVKQDLQPFTVLKDNLAGTDTNSQPSQNTNQ